jgi:hypothetical protein
MFDDDEDRRLGKLLRLKKLEMPSDDRWSEFDRAFENRLLSAVSDSKWKRAFSRISSIFNFKRVIYAAAGVSFLLVVAAATLRDGEHAGSPMASETARKYVKFASDSMFVHCDDIDMESGVCNIGYANDGVEYVHDMMVLRSGAPLLAKMWN